ncbi:FKBP-type peptidyl-prolyl cis-trans isomerase [Actinospica robiniae]|uniref:FKBP-type peptidyl-prolyl cis-trans isomerase n=1 Tax=Actinospica robiniae TaxID=304901 RepID=UPI0012FAA3C8|nr:FKBP-type peptidyl-prolyl cis-trans isomerase [Actinospica robiniae]
MLLLGVSLRHRRRPPHRLLAALAALGLAAGAAACGAGSAQAVLPAVSGAVGEQAAITIPAHQSPPTRVESTVLVQGGGSPLAAGDAVVVDYTLMDWTGGKLIGSTYGTGGSPDKTQEFVLGATSALGSWNQALPGVKVGSRVEVVTPPDGAFGTGGATAYGIKGTDDLVYVLDIVGGYPANADITGIQPTQKDADLPRVAGDPGSGAVSVALPRGERAPATLTSSVLIHGSGAVLTSDQRLMVQYTGVDWNTGKQFDSSFGRGIASFVFGSDSVISGWNKGLAGAHVGDRVLLVLPAADAYGAKGVASAGIHGGDTLVFVIDIVDALG